MSQWGTPTDGPTRSPTWPLATLAPEATATAPDSDAAAAGDGTASPDGSKQEGAEELEKQLEILLRVKNSPHTRLNCTVLGRY